MKFALAGDARCGKSSLLMRFLSNYFSNDIRPTVGVSFRHKRFSDHVRGVFFDASSALSNGWLKNYYGKTNVVMLCVDLQLSTEELEASVSQQLVKIKKYLEPGISIVLIGTKADLVTVRQLLANNKEKLEEISKHHANVQAAFITSAKESGSTTYNAVLCNKIMDTQDSAGFKSVFNTLISIAMSPTQSQQQNAIANNVVRLAELATIDEEVESVESNSDAMESKRESSNAIAQLKVEAIKDKQISKQDLQTCLNGYPFHFKTHPVITKLKKELTDTPEGGYINGGKLYTLFGDKPLKIDARRTTNLNAKSPNGTERVIEEICLLATPISSSTSSY